MVMPWVEVNSAGLLDTYRMSSYLSSAQKLVTSFQHTGDVGPGQKGADLQRTDQGGAAPDLEDAAVGNHRAAPGPVDAVGALRIFGQRQRRVAGRRRQLLRHDLDRNLLERDRALGLAAAAGQERAGDAGCEHDCQDPSHF